MDRQMQYRWQQPYIGWQTVYSRPVGSSTTSERLMDMIDQRVDRIGTSEAMSILRRYMLP